MKTLVVEDIGKIVARGGVLKDGDGIHVVNVPRDGVTIQAGKKLEVITAENDFRYTPITEVAAGYCNLNESDYVATLPDVVPGFVRHVTVEPTERAGFTHKVIISQYAEVLTSLPEKNNGSDPKNVYGPTNGYFTLYGQRRGNFRLFAAEPVYNNITQIILRYDHRMAGR